MLLGICLIPSLSVKLYPETDSNNLYVSYSWRDADAELVESQVTSILEANLTRISGIKDIHSTTYYGGGYIQLKLDSEHDLSLIKLEVSSTIRAIKNKLPQYTKVYPVSEDRRSNYNDENELLLTYVITGPDSSTEVAEYAEENISPFIKQIQGIKHVDISGYDDYEWVLEYDKNVLENFKLSPFDLYEAVKNKYIQKNAGKVSVNNDVNSKYYYIVIKGDVDRDKSAIKDIIVKKIGNKIIRLKEVASINYKAKESSSFYRINGLNRININIYTEPSVNRIDKASELIGQMENFSNNLPKGYSINIAYDSTEELRDEINTIIFRTCFTIFILLSFVLIISMSFRYLSIISISLLANILIAFVIYYFLDVEINIYTMAGITISLGIIIDNVIVMTDHLRLHKDKKVFLAILAATLTTLGALWVVFGMGESALANIKGFAIVILVNLAVSLAVSFFFIPALMDKIRIKKRSNDSRISINRKIIFINRIYLRILIFLNKWKTMLIAIAILGFGTPIYMLPREIEGDKWYNELYNKTLGSDTYSDIKLYVDKCFGGTLRLFTENLTNNSYRRVGSNRIKLYVSLYMEHGATIEQMNSAMKRFENFIAKYDGVDKFTSSCQSARQAKICINFKEEYEESGFPKQLQDDIGVYANSIGNANTSISGLEKGFTNNVYENNLRNSVIKVTGYNYKTLLTYCNKLKDKLCESSRVQNLIIGSDPYESSELGFQLKVDKLKLAKNNSSVKDILQSLQVLTSNYDIPVNAYIDNKMTDFVIRARNKGKISIWDLENMPLKSESSIFRLSDIGKISEESLSKKIKRDNQEYVINVAYDYVGNNKLAKRILKREVKALNKILPIGFKAEDVSQNRGFFSDNAGNKILYILLAFVIIFFICSILLESLKQALAIILLVPISFIGVFIAFHILEVDFGEGGYASFILLCGLIVNSALYIINDYNNKITQGKELGMRTYLRAFNSKIIPIFLTISSTILGFIPFVLGNNITGFWYSIAIGTMSGLLFSIIVLIIYLPIFLPLKRIKK